MLGTLPLPFIAVVVLCLMLFYWYQRPKGSPPGPRGIPVLGMIPFVGGKPERNYRRWSKQYGPVVSVRLGGSDWVILNDFDSINQALVKNGHIFAGRPSFPVNERITKGHGLAMIDYGKLWKDQRKFGLMTLRGFGLGKRGMEDRIIEEASYLCDEIRRRQGKAFSIRTLMAHTVSNVICGVVFGRRFDYKDPWLDGLLHILDKWFSSPRATMFFTALYFAPWLECLPPFSGIMQELMTDLDVLYDRFGKLIKEHRESLDPENVRDFIDAFLVEMQKGTETFTQEQLFQYVRDLFEAGTETTSSTMRWSLLCLLHYPQIQEKLYEEIIDVIGEEGRPTFSMKDKMPYCNAFIHEVGRFRTLLPGSLAHQVSEDVEIQGFTIRKGTTVVPNIWAVHNDPNLFDQPEKFDPGRHIDEKGNFVKSKYVIPFSVGPRFCLGEQLAKMELFLFLTSMVQRFKFEAKPGEMPNIEEGSDGAVFVPNDYELIAVERMS